MAGGLFHYAIAAHRRSSCNNGSSGLGEPGGDDFILALRDKVEWDYPQTRRGTFMHEHGHNLGLRHGGAFDYPERSVNYPSVMSYRFQTRGGVLEVGQAPESAVPDYSHQPLADLDESMLYERVLDGAMNPVSVSDTCRRTGPITICSATAP